jgi:hypothetical protein
MQNLCHSTWDHEILYADSSSKDEQLETIFVENQKYKHGGRSIVKIRIFFMETTHEMWQERKRSWKNLQVLFE